MDESDYTPEEREDMAHLQSLLARLKACADANLVALEQMKPPTTGLEIQRRSRAIKVTRDLLIDMYLPAPRQKPPREPRGPSATERSLDSMSASLSSLLKSAKKHMPASRAERAERPERRETLGEFAEKMRRARQAAAAPPPTVSASNAPDGGCQGTETSSHTELDDRTRACAEWTGYWPDGARFAAGDDLRAHLDSGALPLTYDGAPETRQARFDDELLRRCNLMARQHGRACGWGVDHQRYSDDLPDHWSKSANYNSGRNLPSSGEIASPPGLPWWIVHIPLNSSPSG